MDIESPIRIRKGFSVDSNYKKDYEENKRFSTVKKQDNKSVINSDGVDILTASNPTNLNETIIS